MESNSRLIADLYAAFARGDVPYILDHLADDVQIVHSGSADIPWGGTYEGKEAAMRFFGNIDGAVAMKSFEPKTYLSAGDEVMTTGVESAVAHGTGKAYTAGWAMRFLVTDGKVAFCQVYEDSAVPAAALRP